MAIVMNPSTPSISQISGYSLLAEVRSGGNGDYSGVPEFDIGSGSNDFSTGRTTWTGDLTNGFDSGLRSVRFDAVLGGSAPSSTLDLQGSMTGLLTHPSPANQSIECVQFRVAIQGYRMEMQWQNLSVQFLKDNVVTETVPLPATMDVNSLAPSSSGVAEQLCTVLPSRTDNTEAIVTGSVRLTSMEPDYQPAANELFGQVFVYSTNVPTPPPPKTTFYLKKDPNGPNSDLWINSATPGAGAPDQIFALGGSGPLAILGGAEDDVLTLDFSNGNPLPAGGFNFNGGAGNNNTTAVVGTTGDDTLTAGSGGFTFANAAFGNVPINASNVQNVQFNGGSGGSDSINVAGGSFNIDASTATGTPNVSVTVQAGATAAFTGDQHLENLTVNGAASTPPSAHLNVDGNVSIGNGGSLALNPNQPGSGLTDNFGSLFIGANSSIDIGNTTLLIQSVPNEYVVVGYLQNGYAAGYWNGTSPTGGSIKSITAFNNPSGNITIGYGNASDLNFPGSTSPYSYLTGNQMVIKPTLVGDLMLEGVVGANELAMLTASYGTTTYDGLHLNTWAYGNIDYSADGLVGPNDLALLLAHYGSSLLGGP